MEMNKARGHMKNPGFILKPLGSPSWLRYPAAEQPLNKSLHLLNQRILKSNNRGQQRPLYSAFYCMSDHNKDEIISHRTLAAFCLTRLGHSVEASQVTPDLQQTQGQSPKWTKNTTGFHLILNQFWESNLLKSKLWTAEDQGGWRPRPMPEGGTHAEGTSSQPGDGSLRMTLLLSFRMPLCLSSCCLRFLSHI